MRSPSQKPYLEISISTHLILSAWNGTVIPILLFTANIKLSFSTVFHKSMYRIFRTLLKSTLSFVYSVTSLIREILSVYFSKVLFHYLTTNGFLANYDCWFSLVIPIITYILLSWFSAALGMSMFFCESECYHLITNVTIIILINCLHFPVPVFFFFCFFSNCSYVAFL